LQELATVGGGSVCHDKPLLEIISGIDQIFGAKFQFFMTIAVAAIWRLSR
jgi:hypothetical protein